MRKSGLLLIIFVLLLSQFGGLPAYAAVETEGEYKYVVHGNEATIVEYTGAGGHVEIPAKLGGMTVTVIGEIAFAGKHGKQLTSVTIPAGVTSIGDRAFVDNQRLESVTIPDNVTLIGYGAFLNNGLKEVTIPASVMSIGEMAFMYNFLKSVTIYNKSTVIGSNLFFGNTGDVILYGHQTSTTKNYADANGHSFKPLDKNLTYDGNHQTSGDVPVDIDTYVKDQEVTVLGNVNSDPLLKDGFTFSGWNTLDDGNGTDYLVGSKYLMGEEDVTLYAKWDTNSYTVSFVTNGGTAVTAQPVAFNEKMTAPTAPTKAGHAFEGWYKDAGLTTEWNFTTDVVTENTTLYAKWTVNSPSGGGGGGGYYPSYTLIFDTNEGSTIANQMLYYNDKAMNSVAPIKAGYTFEGWYKEADFKTKWDFATDVVKENTVLYAKWTTNLPSCTAGFTDTATHWAQKEIDEIACQGIILGYQDGAFKPNESITRQQIAVMFTRAFELAPIRSSIKFNDVPTNHKQYDAITQVYQAGIFDGVSNGKFSPNAHMTRAQMAKVLVLAFELRPSATSTNVFHDVPTTHWAKDYIATLADNGIALGDNGNFKPEESITRAQFVAFMYRALNL